MTGQVTGQVTARVTSQRDLLQHQVMLLRALDRHKSRKKFWTYYPDTGPLRREMYPRQIEFFRLGSKVPTRCFMAGNRVGKCCTAQTLIDTPTGPVRIADLRHGDEVYAWGGSRKVTSRIEQPFKKPGLHECALLLMSDGRFVEAADHHRVLTSNGGWKLLSELLPQSFFGHPQSSSAPDRAVHAGGGQPHSPASWHEGGPVTSTSCTPSQPASRPSIRCVLRQRAARCAAWLTRAACTPSEPSLPRRLAAPLLRAAAGLALRSLGAAPKS